MQYSCRCGVIGMSPHFTTAREKSAVSAGLAISYLGCSAVRIQEQNRKRLIHSNSDGFAEKEKKASIPAAMVV